MYITQFIRLLLSFSRKLTPKTKTFLKQDASPTQVDTWRRCRFLKSHILPHVVEEVTGSSVGYSRCHDDAVFLCKLLIKLVSNGVGIPMVITIRKWVFF